ncbi:hypothetical protein [Paracoccus sp. ME4]|uniref:hypothetical protein n=1 Tax=Paracoccus sp. ME4 TaxID=3138066 RepID=UPI00398B3F05
MIFRRYTVGQFSAVARTARIGNGTEIGSHSRIGAGAQIGKGCLIGTHVQVDDGAVVGHRSVLGDYCRIGRGAILGEWVVTGPYTRIAPGVRVPDAVILGDADLVLEDRIIPGFCSGHAIAFPTDEREPLDITMTSGRFRPPYMDEARAAEVIEAHLWGDEQALEPYRVGGERPRPIAITHLIEGNDDACTPGF